MDLSELNYLFLRITFEKLSHENKTMIILGDFDANLSNYNIDKDISNFLDCISCNSLLPHITSPTGIEQDQKQFF